MITRFYDEVPNHGKHIITLVHACESEKEYIEQVSKATFEDIIMMGESWLYIPPPSSVRWEYRKEPEGCLYIDFLRRCREDSNVMKLDPVSES